MSIATNIDKGEAYQIEVIDKHSLCIKGHYSKPKYFVKGKDFYAIVGHRDIELIPCEEALCLIDLREQENKVWNIRRHLSRISDIKDKDKINNTQERLLSALIKLGNSYLSAKNNGYELHKKR